MLRRAIVLGAVAALTGAGAASGKSGADTFRTPSGNIYCAYEHYSFAPVDLRCEIRSGVRPLPPKPASCEFDWGAGYRLRPIGPARVLCISDTIYNPKAKVLGYGTAWYGGGFGCASRTDGLRCTNARGYGFFLSREHSYTFKEASPTNGAFKTPSGNIVCGYGIDAFGAASMECGIKSGLKPPPAPIHCDAGDPNDKRVGLRDTGRATPVLCAGDPGPFLVESKAKVLAYGRTWSGGGISCRSETTGLTCTNRVGHGFFLSRGSWRTF